LRAVRKLRSTSSTDSSPGVPRSGAKNIKGRSQLDMAFDILKEEGRPLHISELRNASKLASDSELTGNRWFQL
jgi:hypothetical protein